MQNSFRQPCFFTEQMLHCEHVLLFEVKHVGLTCGVPFSDAVVLVSCIQYFMQQLTFDFSFKMFDHSNVGELYFFLHVNDNVVANHIGVSLEYNYVHLGFYVQAIVLALHNAIVLGCRNNGSPVMFQRIGLLCAVLCVGLQFLALLQPTKPDW